MKIAEKLTGEGTTSITGKPISVSAVGDILRNITYTGNTLLQKSLTRSAGCHCFHIIYGKDVKMEEISINFIQYNCVILKKCSKGTGRFWLVSFLYAKNM